MRRQGKEAKGARWVEERRKASEEEREGKKMKRLRNKDRKQ